VVQDLKSVMAGIREGQGTAGLLLKDSTLRKTLSNSAFNLEQGTDRFNQNMEALKSNFLFRKYFKKLERERKDSAKAKDNNR